MPDVSKPQTMDEEVIIIDTTSNAEPKTKRHKLTYFASSQDRGLLWIASTANAVAGLTYVRTQETIQIFRSASFDIVSPSTRFLRMVTKSKYSYGHSCSNLERGGICHMVYCSLFWVLLDLLAFGCWSWLENESNATLSWPSETPY
eukprot:Protomagalhaensia_sp_Gyna_25__1308@NODE_1656_length_1654_cov_10_656966_g1354_i0_p2_GENE_NODE_1656_length_1654_cov_10_656966_g1354_i0NODE_1656_length_1654_cov_10_656966_g1354_i0_p2_ORF_typecomplete_len146_score6_37_NODE_1656_length_1654_cov_10_656966_g1354_i09901427